MPKFSPSFAHLLDEDLRHRMALEDGLLELSCVQVPERRTKCALSLHLVHPVGVHEAGLTDVG